MNWFTNVNHHESLAIEVNTQKNLESEKLGDKVSKLGVAYSDIHGLLPLKEEYTDTFEDVVLNGKIVFYEKGLIYVDNKIHALALPYDHIEALNFYVTDKEWWLEILTQENEKSNLKVDELFPMNVMVQKKVYLKIDQKIFDEKFKVLEKEMPEKVHKIYEECPYVHNSLAMKNFFVNLKYSSQYSSDFMNQEFNLKLHQEYMEFNALYEFNKNKGKEFIPLSAFSKVYREAD